MNGFTERTWTSADGLSLVASDYAGGAGAAKSPVICIHGLTRNAKDFEVVAPVLAERTGRRVLAIDVRGRGRSARDPNPMNYNPIIYAGDLIALMGQAGLARAVFVGTSMGGLITMMLAASRPDLIAAAALNDVGPEVGAAGLARIAGYVGGGQPVQTWDDAVAYIRSINGEALPHLTDDDWRAFARRTFRETNDGLELDYDPAISHAFKAPPPAPHAPQPTLWPLFNALASGRPLLVVRGAESDILEAATLAKMAEAAPHMQAVERPGVGHAPTLEEAQALDGLVKFLEAAP
jgi:pimeloyl-ACP methyl ester carboxylesterase